MNGGFISRGEKVVCSWNLENGRWAAVRLTFFDLLRWLKSNLLPVTAEIIVVDAATNRITVAITPPGDVEFEIGVTDSKSPEDEEIVCVLNQSSLTFALTIQT